MSIRRIGVLLVKEFTKGSRSMFFIFALVVPVVLTLVVSLLFGTIFSGKARLGLTDLGDSQLVTEIATLESIIVKQYDAQEALRAAVADGAVDIGIVLPAQYDELVSKGETVQLTVFVWGESTLINRATPATAVVSLTRDLIGQEAPVEIVTETLGENASLPWGERLLPFVLMMAIMLGGMMVPAASLVEEKQKRTLRAITTTSVSLGEVFVAKGLTGVILSVVMAVVTLLLNQAFGGSPWLLLFVLFLGAVMSASIGILAGAFISDITTLFSVFKAGGILLYAPALIYMFPSIPQWIGMLFPTYYLIYPVIEITQQGATFTEVALELAVLCILIAVLLGIIAVVIQRSARYEGSLNPA